MTRLQSKTFTIDTNVHGKPIYFNLTLRVIVDGRPCCRSLGCNIYVWVIVTYVNNETNNVHVAKMYITEIR